MEDVYTLKYFPESGDRYSPEDFINGLTNYHDVAKVEYVLGKLSDHKKMEWGSHVEIEHIRGLTQITGGSHRLYVYVDGKYLVIYYICRKKSQKPLKQDLDRACINIQKYLREKR